MSIRDVLILTAMVIGCVAVISWFTGDPKTQPAATDESRSVEPQPLVAEKRASQRPDSRVTAPATASAAAPTPAEKLPTPEPRRPIRGGKRRNEPPGEQFNEGVLSDLDYSPETIRFIRTLWEQSVEAQNDRANRSDRKDWVTPEPIDTDITDTLRSDLGDDLYDAMLYATNQPNRVKVSNVMRTSAAAAAGLRIKDVIVSYDGNRVFDPDETKRLSESSDPDRRVDIWILRNGKNIHMEINGGPLGIRYFPDWKLPIRD